MQLTIRLGQRNMQQFAIGEQRMTTANKGVVVRRIELKKGGAETGYTIWQQ